MKPLLDVLAARPDARGEGAAQDDEDEKGQQNANHPPSAKGRGRHELDVASRVALPVGPAQQLRNVVLKSYRYRATDQRKSHGKVPVAHVQPLLRGRICFVMKLRYAERCILHL